MVSVVQGEGGVLSTAAKGGIGEQESVCEALQLLIWPSLKGGGRCSFVHGWRGLSPKIRCSLLPSLRSFSWGPPGLAPLASGSLHAHLFYRSRLEVPMYSCTHVPMSPQMQLLPSIGASYGLRSWMPLPAASNDFLVTTSAEDDYTPSNHC